MPACDSCSPAFCMLHSAYELSKLGDNVQPDPTHFSVWNQSVVPSPVLTVALGLMQVFQDAGNVVCIPSV